MRDHFWRKGVLIMGAVCLLAAGPAALPAEAAEILVVSEDDYGFREDGEYICYILADGTKAVDMILTKNDKSFYFDSEGHLLQSGNVIFRETGYQADKNGVLSTASGWLFVGEEWYYLEKSGKVVKDTFITVKEKEYCLLEDGRLAHDTVVERDGVLYYALSSGAIRTEKGWINGAENWYYAEEGGALVRNDFVKNRGKTYYLGDDGAMLTSGNLISGDFGYRAASDGELTVKSGWLVVGEDWYYTSSAGVLFRDIMFTRKNLTYYLDADGRMARDAVILTGGEYYYFGSTGTMETKEGWITLDEEIYHVTEGGKLSRSTFLRSGSSYYYIGGQARALRDQVTVLNGSYYYFGVDGKLVQTEGWVTKNGNWYYVQTGGVLLRDSFLRYKERDYYIRANCKMAHDVIVERDGKKYIAQSNGALRNGKGWALLDGKWYYTDAAGVMQSGKVINDGGKYYYLDQDGAAVISSFVTVGGKTYYAGKTGAFYLEKGWLHLSDGWYYIQEGGNLLRGKFVEESGKKYFVETDGRLVISDWIYSGDDLYYAGANGAILPDRWYKIDGKWYHSDQDGKIIRAAVVKSGGVLYYMDALGEMVTSCDVVTLDLIGYRADEKGKLTLAEGWLFPEDGGMFYAGTDGKVYCSRLAKIDGKRYYFGDFGMAEHDGFFFIGENLLYAGEDGALVSEAGWITVDDHQYLANEYGLFYHSTTIKENGRYYYFNAFGQWENTEDYYFTGIFEDTSYISIGDRRYHVDKNGNIDSWFGIDVSAWNGDIDWKRVAADGVDFAFIRAGGRFAVSGGLYDDSKLVENIEGATAEGIPVGVYFFTGATTVEEAIEEAQYTIKRIKGLNVELPIVIDTEYYEGGRHSAISRATRTAVVKAFCDTVEKAGYHAMYYAGMAWCESELDTTQLSDYMHWCAQWWIRNQCDDLGIPYQIWQYSEDGSVDGIDGDVDINIWFRHKEN